MEGIAGRAIVAATALLLAACSTARETEPPRTATEQLLISAAADRAADQMIARFPPGTKVFVDAQYFDGIDAKYTIGAIRDRLARAGAHLVTDRGTADLVVELRSGAQSIDQNSMLVGIPSFDVPIPLAGAFKFPEISLFKKAQQTGTAKIAMTGYEQKTGLYRFTVGPDYGYSHLTNWTVFLFISWTTNDLHP
jgi:hypothetical protein